jgi:hypothetical protein
MRCEHPSHPPDPGDIDIPILAAEAEPSGEMRSHLIAIQYLYSFACGMQVASQGMRDGGFASRREAGKP